MCRAAAVRVYRDPAKVKRSRSTRQRALVHHTQVVGNGGGILPALDESHAPFHQHRSFETGDGRSVQQLPVLGHHDQLDCEPTDLRRGSPCPAASMVAARPWPSAHV